MKRRTRKHKKNSLGIAGKIVRLETRRLLATMFTYEVTTLEPNEASNTIYVVSENSCLHRDKAMNPKEYDERSTCEFRFYSTDFDAFFASTSTYFSDGNHYGILRHQDGNSTVSIRVIETQPSDSPPSETEFLPLAEVEKHIEAGNYFAQPSNKNAIAPGMQQPPEAIEEVRLSVQPLLAIIPPGEVNPNMFGSFQSTTPPGNAFGFSNPMSIETAKVSSLVVYQPLASIYSFQFDRPVKENRNFDHNILDRIDHVFEQLSEPTERADVNANLYSLKFLSFDHAPSEDTEPAPNIHTLNKLRPIIAPEARTEPTKQDRLARQIQVVESAVVLLGLPGSRLCRDEDLNEQN